MNNIFYQLLLPLLVAHLLGDFVFQSDKDVENKKNTFVFAKHILILTILSYILTGFWDNPFIALTILATHTIIDLIKRAIKKDSLFIFLGDQFAHLLVIFVLSYYALNIFVYDNCQQSFWYNLLGTGYLKTLTVLASMILASKFSSIIVGYIIRPFQSNSTNSVGKELQNNTGRLIGQLERVIILILFIADMAAVVGFLITAKSILRYGEIKDEKDKVMVEYVLVGTLISFTLGIAVGLITIKFLSIL